MFNPLRALALGGLLLFSALGHVVLVAPDTLRIGYQKGSINMVLAKNHQLLEQHYPGTHISWIEPPTGPQMLEVLNVGNIDTGSIDDIPPTFAQVAGADLIYIGLEPLKPKAEVTLAAQGSPIHNVAELKGKKVAFQEGSSSHNLLPRILQLAGPKFNDTQPAYLASVDVRAAFQQDNVDAWVIWDPHYSAALPQSGVRILTGGINLERTGSFYLASHPYAECNGAFIEGTLDILTQADVLAHSQCAQSTTLLTKAMGLSEAVIVSYLGHHPPTSVTLVSVETAAHQQQMANLFYESRLVSEKVDIRAHIWQPTVIQGAKS